MMRQGLLVHPSVFVSETLSLLNSHYMPPESFTPGVLENAELDSAINRLCQQGITNSARESDTHLSSISAALRF
jgi:hypothetical protein